MPVEQRDSLLRAIAANLPADPATRSCATRSIAASADSQPAAASGRVLGLARSFGPDKGLVAPWARSEQAVLLFAQMLALPISLIRLTARRFPACGFNFTHYVAFHQLGRGG
jgi:hypothetical protein